MKLRTPTPRLLPATIAMLAVVLVAKTLSLVGAVTGWGGSSGMIASALAGGHGAAAPPPAHGAPAHGPPAHGAKPDAKPAAHGGQGKPAAEPPPAPEPPPVPAGPPPMTESEKTVLLDLRERRRDLEARETALAAREATMAAAERKVSSRVEELQGLQKKLESLDAGRKTQDDTSWQGLVKVYETMKPREAATIFNDLAMPVLLSVLDRMKETKAAAILAAMTPDKAREVTTQLALSRTRAATADSGGKSPPPPPPGKIPGSGT